MTGLVDGKVAFVTGAGSGIGRATAELFAAEGARAVLVCDVDADTVAETARGVEAAGGQALARIVDVADADAVQAAVDDALRAWGRIDCAVNNAGISGPRRPLHEYTVDDWRRVLGINLDGVFHCMIAQLASMLAAGRGSIVNVSSGAAVHPTVGLAPYAASKAGLVGLTRAAAGDYAAQGIRLNCVLPGPTRTTLWESNLGADPDAALRRLEEAAPMGRIGTSEELAETIVWLSSDRASYVHGVDLLVDGGTHAFSMRRAVPASVDQQQ